MKCFPVFFARGNASLKSVHFQTVVESAERTESAHRINKKANFGAVFFFRANMKKIYLFWIYSQSVFNKAIFAEIKLI